MISDSILFVVDRVPPRPPLPREFIPPQRPHPAETDDEDEGVFRTMPQPDQPIKVNRNMFLFEYFVISTFVFD